MKMMRQLVMDPSITDPMTSDILDAIRAAQEVIQPTFPDLSDEYDPGEFEEELEDLKKNEDPLQWWSRVTQKADGKTMHRMVKYYLDNVEKIMVKYVDALREAMLTDIKGSESNYQSKGTWDENIMDQIKVKKVYILNTFYKKRGMAGFPTDEEFKKFISDMDAEGIELFSAKAQEIIDTVAGKLQAR